MRVALFIESSPATGGAFHQAFSAVESIARTATSHEFVIFTPHKKTRDWLLERGFSSVLYTAGAYRHLDRWSATQLGGAFLRRARSFGLRNIGRHLDALLDRHSVDFVVLNECGDAALRLGDHPFAVTVFDTDHRDHPEFAEIYTEGVFERRENWLRVTLPRAVAVIANSHLGAERLVGTYQVDPSRIIELPFRPSFIAREQQAPGTGIPTERVLRRHGIFPGYVFYPAFFSFHKNHLYLIESLIELERRHGIVLHAVFCGGGLPGDQENVERQAQALGMTQRVHFLGLVPDNEMPALYKAALVMAMPSHFGPTNLPPLEAASLGCPVVCSDIPGCREQMGDAALYCDLSDPGSLADHLVALHTNPAMCTRLREAGLKLAANLETIAYAERLRPLFDDFAYVRRRWSLPALDASST
jgi:glycosyltransferase involved in cell wall biosynthesis